MTSGVRNPDIDMKNNFIIFQSRILVAILTSLFGLFLYADTFAQNANSQQDRINELLYKIALARDSISYEALTTYEFFTKDGIRREQEKSIILGSNRGWWQTIIPEESKNRVVILRDNVYYIVYLDKDSVGVRLQSSRGGIIKVENIALLKKNYYVEFLPEEKIQNYLADVVKISPRNKDRSRIKIWVDKKTGFFFRFEKYDKDNNKVFQRFRENVVFNPNADESIFNVEYSGAIPIEPKRKTYKSILEVAQELNIPLVTPQFPPSGFVLSEISVYRGEQPVVQLYYADGLWSFSLFQRKDKRKEREIEIGEDRNGRITWISAVKDNIFYWYVGDLEDVDRDTIIKSFKSIKLFDKTKLSKTEQIIKKYY